MRYGFGKNWAEFVQKNLSEERVKIAQNCLLGFLKLRDLKGQTFLDIGCGSGIHSLAAYRAGAKHIMSFDYDTDSVETTRKVREFAGNPQNWQVEQGSVLDRGFMDSLARADIVYSWGVLHHTGQMWKAIENAASAMEETGVFYIALYTKDVYLNPPPEYWLRLKKKYNMAGPVGKKWIELRYALRHTFLPTLRTGRNPFRDILDYKRSRGMSYWTDVKDWLGGWPMEFAGIAETKAFCSNKLQLELLNIKAGEGNTEYLFRKMGVKNYWEDLFKSLTVESLPGPFTHHAGYAWIAPLKHYSGTADTNEHPRRSRLMLYENDVPLGFAHAPHSHIEAHGGSRYSHWEDHLIFSTSDNSDPNTNERHYSICVDML